MIQRIVTTLAVLSIASCAGRSATTAIQPALDAASGISGGSLRAHMATLAADTMEGRETGTPGFDRAAQYVASEFADIGLDPLGAGYLQPVTIRRWQVDEASTTVTVTSRQAEALAYGVDFVTYGLRGPSSASAAGDVLFMGHGVTLKERGIDAYGGVDTTGKVVMLLSGAPASLSPGEQAFHGDAQQKVDNAAKHGAVAVILIDAPQIPWALRVRAARQLGVSGSLPIAQPNLPLPLIYLRPPAAERLLGRSLDSPDLPLGRSVGSAAITLRQSSREVRSANVAATLPGSDSARASEHVVIVAHLDHIGIGEAENGDSIYNGAIDNASGVSALLTVARAFASLPRAPARSLIFLATTGEEQGLVGADHFVRQSTTVPYDIVAAINMDGTAVVPFQALDIRGGANSSLGLLAQEAGAQLGIGTHLEPAGVGGSDHSPFLLAGIPPLWIGAALADDWMRTHYHTPRDDMQQPIDWDAATTYARFVFLTAHLAAENSKRPEWNRGEFFGERHAP
jgi:hypothetical protein